MEFGLKVFHRTSLILKVLVSILVLMEFGLKEFFHCFCIPLCTVSILVLMEFGLKAKDRTTYVFTIQRVSILVLMEFGLKEEIVASQKLLMLGFNPCFNGIWFKRTARELGFYQAWEFQSLF